MIEQINDAMTFRESVRAAMSPTDRRVEAHTSPSANAMIRRRIEFNVHFFARRPQEIDRRLWELDREWDIERMLETNSATITLASLILGGFIRPLRWVPLLVQGFLLQHAIQGWCPPLPILRQMGIRTMREINHERYALKALRGDFGPIPETGPEAAARFALWAAEPGRNGE
jgi:hypothetical protein